MPDVIKSLNQNKNIVLRNPYATRPWQHVLEPLSGYLTLGKKLIKKELKSNLKPSWNFGPPPKNCKEVNYIVKNIIEKWPYKNQIRIKNKKDKNFHESKLLSLNIQKAKKELMWKPKLSLNETIEMTVEWYKDYFEKKNIEEKTNNQIEFYSEK